MDRVRNAGFAEAERRIYALISRRDGLKAREIAELLRMDRTDVNRELYNSALMRELCYQDREYRWHAVIRQARPHEGLYEFSGWYGLVREFTELSEEAWMEQMREGCRRIGRNLNDQRGLLHSFRDWELAFEFRLNRGRWIRIYADVLLITPDRVFSLEFKMKDTVQPEEVLQAAKYVPYLEIIFGPAYEALPALVLTAGADFFEYVPIGDTGAILPACSGDMLFNVLDEYMGFLRR